MIKHDSAPRPRTGNPDQDRILARKIADLKLSPIADSTEQEANSESVEIPEARRRRIVQEDAMLAGHPLQRRTLLLDYIRRGRLRDGKGIMPEMIQVAPALVDSGLIDFQSDQYDEQGTIADILRHFENIRTEVEIADTRVRDLFTRFGVEAVSKKYLDARWLSGVRKKFAAYKTNIDNPRPQHPAVRAGKLEEYIADEHRRFMNQLAAEFQGSVDTLVDAYVADPSCLDAGIPELRFDDPIEQFVIAKCEGGFRQYPTASEYTGPVVQGPPDFSTVRVKPGLRLIERDSVPEEAGGIIFDGNFGYNEQGNIIQPDDKIIIDHHDALNEKQYDTATVMATRFWEERLGRKFSPTEWKKELKRLRADGIIESGKKLITMVNEPDTDAILAVWAFRNPRKAEQYSEVINNISFCGDFLVGSKIMNYGANARDYNYIIMNYLDACKEKIRDEKIQQLQQKKQELINALAESNVRLADMQRQRDDIQQTAPEIQLLVNELNTIRSAPPDPPKMKERGQRMNALKQQIEQTAVALLGDAAAQEYTEFELRSAELTKQIAGIDAFIKAQSQARMTPEQNAKIVSHFLDVIEDIIQNPFKYRTFLEKGREQEERGLQQVEQLYQNGEIEILPYEADSEMIQLIPQGRKDMPSLESIDGMYFFLRRRVDFNQPIIITVEAGSYLVAVNTQDKAELKRYDFNELLPRIKLREHILLQEKLATKQTERAATTDPKKAQVLDKELDRLQDLIKRNTQGKLWRNRNQMAFALRTLIPQEEFLARVHEWKQLEEVERTIDGTKKNEVAQQVAEYRTLADQGAVRIMELGNWPKTGNQETDHETARHAIVERIPATAEGAFAGFDAGVACALDLIPRDKQNLAAELHANYTPEAIANILEDTKDMYQLDPDSPTCWWLAACSVCSEGSTNQRGFLKQIALFDQLRQNPQARKEAAILTFQKMISRFHMETFIDVESGEAVTIPFGDEDGCIQGSYLAGHPFGVSHMRTPTGEWYEIGSYQPTLGLEDFQWKSTFQRNGRTYQSGSQYGSRNFMRCGSKEEMIRALVHMRKTKQEK